MLTLIISAEYRGNGLISTKINEKSQPYKQGVVGSSPTVPITNTKENKPWYFSFLGVCWQIKK